MLGTFEVPLYLTEDGEPGTRFDNGADGLPERNGDWTADFECAAARRMPTAAGADGALRPRAARQPRERSRPGNIADFVREHEVAFCATDWIGMSEDDVGNAVSILGQLGEFPTLADRSQQGILNFLFLGRLMIHEDGLVSDPAFQLPGSAHASTPAHWPSTPTARAGSWAGRPPRWPRTGPGRCSVSRA